MSLDRPIFDSGKERHHLVEDDHKGIPEGDKGEAMSGALHTETLYDQDEDAAGNKYNAATGKPFNNSKYTGLEGLREVSADALDNTDDEDDAAAKWLRANDPEKPKS